MISSRLAGGQGNALSAPSGEDGGFVTRYPVVNSGNVAGSVVATTARSVFCGPYGPATISTAHQSWVLPSRNVLVIWTHRPGCSALTQPASRATSRNEPATPSGCHQAR